MTHQISFKGAENHWSNALPLGNGRSGAMVFREDSAIHIALNQYDSYYSILSRPDQAEGNTFEDPARKEKTYKELCERYNGSRDQEDYERYHYQRTLQPEDKTQRPHYRSSSYPMASEVVIRFDNQIDMCDADLCLHIEEGKVTWQAGKDDRVIRMELFVPDAADGLLLQLHQSRPGLWKDAALTLPSARGLKNVSVSPAVRNRQLVHTAELCRGEGETAERTPLFDTALAVQGKSAAVSGTGEIRFGEEGNWWMAAGVMTGRGRAEENNEFLLCKAEQLREEHRRKWKERNTASVSLPDTFLETLWHLNLYMLECCCGENGGKQACGLSGLWDIRRPNLWGSLWYWDVNIQTVFQGTFTANHTELAKVFCDTYLSYTDDIHAYTKRVYGREGWAPDYPHSLYNCIQPWCAQFLWNYYRYTQDLEFLKQKAYPVFREQIAFFKELAGIDADGKRCIEPDISPEQGTVSRNSTISLSCIKQLLKIGICAAQESGRPENEAAEFRELLSQMPDYPVTGDGKRFKDSELTQDAIFLRHPSLLMPIFPAEEITAESEEPMYTRALETLRYAAQHTEIGTFGFSWLAGAAAALGDGEGALGLLYEKGLDHILHSNGLGYEESERFINYCHITKKPNFLPAMCEVGGGIVSTVNRMLLSFGADGTICLFPAIPDGKTKLPSNTYQYKQDDRAMDADYPAWKDCAFKRLLAPGGFEVSARREEGRVVWLRIFSRYEAVLRVIMPEELSGGQGERRIEKRMCAGEILECGREESDTAVPCKETDRRNRIQVRKAAGTGRRIFLGEDRHTEFYKMWDSFTCPYLMGDCRQQQMTPYIFDFSPSEDYKSYDNVYERQRFEVQNSILYAAGPIKVGRKLYEACAGYGFDSTQRLETADRREPDDIRRDFAEGDSGREFWIDLPRGKYNLLLISGDEKEASVTHVELKQNGMKLNGQLTAPQNYQCRILPVVHRKDEILRISLDTDKGMKWKLNALIISKEYAFL